MRVLLEYFSQSYCEEKYGDEEFPCDWYGENCSCIKLGSSSNNNDDEYYYYDEPDGGGGKGGGRHGRGGHGRHGGGDGYFDNFYYEASPMQSWMGGGLLLLIIILIVVLCILCFRYCNGGSGNRVAGYNQSYTTQPQTVFVQPPPAMMPVYQQQVAMPGYYHMPTAQELYVQPQQPSAANYQPPARARHERF